MQVKNTKLSKKRSILF